MAYGAMGPQPHQIGNQAYFRSGAVGAKLIARIPLFAGTTNGVVPDGANWLSSRAVGAGGGANPSGNPSGSGGAFAREDRSCTPGQAYTAVVGAGVNAGNGGNSTLTLAGILILLAEGGKTGQTPGLAANCVGTIKASGGAGNFGGNGAAGTNGGSGGSGPPGGAGGGSAGERNVADALMLGGLGADCRNGRGGFPGGGAQFFYSNSGGDTSTAAGGDGLMFLEFWTAKP
ncbi:hypothetical protein PMNALOAF_1257 [Methylobacterium adhaesivum]|nr:hypothetical protein PMNALOAF_1257 [Methylobacterium adhaesivum]